MYFRVNHFFIRPVFNNTLASQKPPSWPPNFYVFVVHHTYIPAIRESENTAMYISLLQACKRCGIINKTYTIVIVDAAAILPYVWNIQSIIRINIPVYLRVVTLAAFRSKILLPVVSLDIYITALIAVYTPPRARVITRGGGASVRRVCRIRINKKKLCVTYYISMILCIHSIREIRLCSYCTLLLRTSYGFCRSYTSDSICRVFNN